MRILLTGHTGFKGAYLLTMLQELGHVVGGYSIDVAPSSLYSLGNLDQAVEMNFRADVGDEKALGEAIDRFHPDAVIHMAAQSLVSKGYEDPVQTMRTNVWGTISVLEVAMSARRLPVMVVTSDKAYLPKGQSEPPHTEDDELGGNDPYSLSKSIADQAALTYLHSTISQSTLTIARAGNVYGGGDHNSGRLFVDIARYLEDGTPLSIRQPHAVRPWQHVLDCVYGYVQLLGHQMETNRTGPFNFGPIESPDATVLDVIETVSSVAGREIYYELVPEPFPETKQLRIDSSKARTILGWEPVVTLEYGIELSMEFIGAQQNYRKLLVSQVRGYLSRQRASNGSP